jgi:hypothetical protein
VIKVMRDNKKGRKQVPSVFADQRINLALLWTPIGRYKITSNVYINLSNAVITGLQCIQVKYTIVSKTMRLPTLVFSHLSLHPPYSLAWPWGVGVGDSASDLG